MKHGSLFSGIGGFDLAAEWMGWENVFHCEWNPFGQRVLKYYWPHAESFDDITKTDFTKYNGTIDIISGGFPCQPYSSAGKRLGKEDERHLWPHMLRAIEEIAPRFVVGENVRGLTNWNGGMVFDEVCSDLENLGYSVAPYLIPASAVNAPHKRERIWFIAYRERIRLEHRQEARNIQQNERTPQTKGCEFAKSIETNGGDGNVANTTGKRLEGNGRQTNGFAKPCSFEIQNGKWHTFPTESPICSRNDGFSNKLDGITFSKWRKESIMAYGNAVCPPLVFEIFKAIEKFDQTNEPT